MELAEDSSFEQFLSGQLAVPYLPKKGLITRTRLFNQLEKVFINKLSLIIAPAGYGKTTLLSQWAKKLKLPLAWYTLNDYDNDPTRFWQHMILTLDKLLPGLYLKCRSLLLSGELQPSRSLVPLLLQQLIQLTEDSVLIVDDYHYVVTPSIQKDFQLLLQNLPPQLHVVIASRATLPFSLERLRLNDDLFELGSEEIRFDQKEIISFIEQFGTQLNQANLQILEGKTAGWIAALKLWQLSCIEKPVIDKQWPSVSSQFYLRLSDYLAEEVLRQLSPNLQDFLLETSILESFSLALCEAVTGRSAFSQLKRVEKLNLFLIRLDEHGDWYRYHDLFAQFLSNHLNETYPEKVSVLHLRAANWYGKVGLYTQAIKHSFFGNDLISASDFLEKISLQLLARNELTLLLKWLQALPEELIRPRPQLTLVKIWILLISGQPASAMAWLPLPGHFPTDLLGSSNDDKFYLFFKEINESSDNLVGQLKLIYSAILSMSQEASEGEKVAEQVLRQYKLDDNLVCIAWWVLAFARHHLGSLEQAIENYAEAERLSQPANNLTVQLLALGGLGDVLNVQGKLDAALQIYDKAIQLGSQFETLPFSGLSQAYRGMGEIFYHRNELTKTRFYLEKAIDTSERTQDHHVKLYSSVYLSRLEQTEGHSQKALIILNQACTLATEYGLAEITLYLEAERAQLFILQGNLTAAEDWWKKAFNNKQLGIDFNYSLLPSYVTAIQLHLAQGRYELALSLLKQTLNKAENCKANAFTYSLLIFQALIYDKLNQQKSAFDSLFKALSATYEEGYLRTYLDQGEPLATLLKLLIKTSYFVNLKNSKDKKLADYIRVLLASFENGFLEPVRHTATCTPNTTSSETLSQRELEILTLLGSGVSNQEIALQLSISLNTVKTHLKNIYVKLGVSNRTQAIVRAKQLSLF